MICKLSIISVFPTVLTITRMLIPKLYLQSLQRSLTIIFTQKIARLDLIFNPESAPFYSINVPI